MDNSVVDGNIFSLFSQEEYEEIMDLAKRFAEFYLECLEKVKQMFLNVIDVFNEFSSSALRLETLQEMLDNFNKVIINDTEYFDKPFYTKLFGKNIYINNADKYIHSWEVNQYYNLKCNLYRKKKYMNMLRYRNV